MMTETVCQKIQFVPHNNNFLHNLKGAIIFVRQLRKRAIDQGGFDIGMQFEQDLLTHLIISGMCLSSRSYILSGTEMNLETNQPVLTFLKRDNSIRSEERRVGKECLL